MALNRRRILHPSPFPLGGGEGEWLAGLECLLAVLSSILRIHQQFGLRGSAVGGQQSFSALAKEAMSAEVCVALTVKRRRASPRATAGYRTGGMKMPRARSAADISIALPSAPTISGMIALFTGGSFQPAPTSTFLTSSTRCQ